MGLVRQFRGDGELFRGALPPGPSLTTAFYHVLSITPEKNGTGSRFIRRTTEKSRPARVPVPVLFEFHSNFLCTSYLTSAAVAGFRGFVLRGGDR